MLFEEKMSILSPNILKFYRDEKSVFDVDRRKAGAVAKALQSKPAPTVITKKDARLTLNDLRGDHHSEKGFSTVIFTNCKTYCSF